MSDNTIHFEITENQRKTLVVFTIFAAIFMITGFILGATIPKMRPPLNSETFTLEYDDDYDSIPIAVPDQYFVEISVETNDYVDVALFTLEDFEDKYSGRGYTRLLHIWTDDVSMETSVNLDGGSYVIEAQSNSDVPITVVVSYTIFPDRTNQSKGWWLAGALAPFAVIGLGLAFGMVTAIKQR